MPGPGVGQRVHRGPGGVIAVAARAADRASRSTVRRCALADAYAASCTARAAGDNGRFAGTGGGETSMPPTSVIRADSNSTAVDRVGCPSTGRAELDQDLCGGMTPQPPGGGDV